LFVKHDLLQYIKIVLNFLLAVIRLFRIHSFIIHYVVRRHYSVLCVRKVALENCVACNDRGDWLTVSGVVRVANLAFDKQLTIVYSADGWASAGQEVEASYLPGSSDGATDRFAFVLEPPPSATAKSGARLEFALKYTTGGQTYWDNNAGTNYGVNCSSIDPSAAVKGTAGQ